VGNHEEIEVIRNAVNSCKDYVDKLLFLVKRSSVKDVVDLNRSVRDSADILRVYAKDRGVIIDTRLGETAHIIGNEADIRHLVLNLVMNAIQASERGESVLVRAGREGNLWVLEVEDRGTGIDPEELGKIFIPFYQGKNKREGSGLGLAIVDSIVREYGGSIDVSSTPSVGSLFKVSIPIS